jgi:hypothetical protein
MEYTLLHADTAGCGQEYTLFIRTWLMMVQNLLYNVGKSKVHAGMLIKR